MSTVEVEFQNAGCPKCGVEALEYFDHYLRTSELVEMCDCGVELEYTPVSCYQAVCDHCGKHITNYGDWCAIGPTQEAMWDSLPDWKHLDGRDLCEDCWRVSDDEIMDEPHEVAPTIFPQESN